jgi:hypothetical protein
MPRRTRDMNETDAVPYFLWNENTTVGELRAILQNPEDPARAIYAGRVMREGTVADVWQFLTPREVEALWPRVQRYLGRRRNFWKQLLEAWKSHGAL